MELRLKRPKNVHVERGKNGVSKIYYRVKSGPRVRLPGPIWSPAFRAAYDAAKAGTPLPVPQVIPPTFRARAEEASDKKIGQAIKSARSRARKKGLSFSLTPEWALNEMRRQSYLCSLTGIPFMSRFERKTKVHPFAPSIDRIDCSKGYDPENVRIVIFAINAMMMDWGEEVFAQVTRSYRLSKIKSRRIATAPSISDPHLKKNARKSTA